MEDNGSFADAIGLKKNWPREVSSSEEMSSEGLLVWAEAYFRAAEGLYLEHFDRSNPKFYRSNFAFYSGPIMQNVGLATELALKALLSGDGMSQKEVKSFSHNTYAAYFKARHCFDEVKFLNLYFSNSDHLVVPDEVRKKLEKEGEKDIGHRWRVYFDHLRVLDSVYHRPYRNRYAKPGPILLPEAELILIGTKIILAAMRDRISASTPSAID
ncbi:MAG: hypothetical protein COB08_017200 [Rhodobacteraceae bacterium]|nr:hypothetical protein [Paracoccaceae bacterium]